MTKKKGAPAPADELRRCAEERLVTRGETTADMQANLLKLVHELQVHQIELEMQNDALVAAQAEIEDGQRFTDLYEFAPVAYFSIDPDTSIRLLNQAAASLLGLPATQLKGLRLATYVATDSLSAFSHFIELPVLPPV